MLRSRRGGAPRRSRRGFLTGRAVGPGWPLPARGPVGWAPPLPGPAPRPAPPPPLPRPRPPPSDPVGSTAHFGRLLLLSLTPQLLDAAIHLGWVDTGPAREPSTASELHHHDVVKALQPMNGLVWFWALAGLTATAGMRRGPPADRGSIRRPRGACNRSLPLRTRQALPGGICPDGLGLACSPGPGFAAGPTAGLGRLRIRCIGRRFCPRPWARVAVGRTWAHGVD